MNDPTHLTRRAALGAIGASVAALAARPGHAATERDVLVEELRVPFDHAAAAGDGFRLRYGLLSPFDPRRQTVFVVADGQQFYVSPEAFGPSVRPIFGDRFNVVGLFGRAEAPEVQARIGSGDAVDWTAAHRLLRAEQWIGDLDAVRRTLLGAEGRVALYGRSGGAFLAHQFMARHGGHVDRLFTQAAVNPFLEARFGLSSDHFWDELPAEDRDRLAQVLASGRYPRARIATLFQRQNFFVPRAELPAARRALIADLVAGHAERLAAREADYQIDALARLDATPRGPAMHVRLFEFFAPVMAGHREEAGALYPDREVSARFAAPLTSLLRAGTIDVPAMDFVALHRLDAEVVMLAGRWDHTCDYRTQIALAACYPNSRLVLLDDDHVFHRLRASGETPALVQAAIEGGTSSPALAAALSRIERLRWSESRADSA